MKNIISKKVFILSLLMSLVYFGSCSDDEHKNVTPEKEGEVEVTLFTPIAGGKSTELKLYGTNFGVDLDNIRVTVNGVDAIVKSSSGQVIIAEVAKGSGSGLVKVIIGENANPLELTYKYEFTYSTKPVVTTLVGGGASVAEGNNDGSYTQAKLSRPSYLSWNDDELYIVEEKSGAEFPATIRVAKANEVKTILNAAVASSTIDRPRAITFSLDKKIMYLGNDKNAAGPISFGKMTKVSTDFESPENIWDNESVTALAVHPTTGNIFFVGYSNDSWIYKYDISNNSVTKMAKLTETDGGTVVGKPNTSCFLFDKNSNDFYVVAKGKHVIFKGEYDSQSDNFSGIHICAGKLESAGFSDGLGADATFNEPWQADFGADGNLYIADRKNHRIRMMTPEGVVSTYSGNGTSGTTDGSLDIAQFNHPQGLQFGPDGALYVADYWNHRIRKIEAE